MGAAVPKYVGQSFDSCPPGHRFRLYFEGWDRDWAAPKSKFESAAAAVDMKRFSGLVDAWLARREAVAAGLPEERVFKLAAWATAPLVTGMGMEHPLENGFAFLDPYGLPYLPGSSIKGVLRRAAEELALFETDPQGWTLPDVWWLFGFDGKSGFFTSDKTDKDGKLSEAKAIRDERARWHQAYQKQELPPHALELIDGFMELALSAPERAEAGENRQGFLDRLHQDEKLRSRLHLRGSVDVWDVIPRVPGNRLRVDIMNPHYRHYFQGKVDSKEGIEPPGDWGDPNPVIYLTLPAGSQLNFLVHFNPVGSLPDTYGERWASLIDAAFGYAFDWLGFGGKTSQGYGQMSRERQNGVRLVEVSLSAPPPPQPVRGGNERYRGRPEPSARPRAQTPERPEGGAQTPLEASIAAFDIASKGPKGLAAILKEIAGIEDRSARGRLLRNLKDTLPPGARYRVLWVQALARGGLKGEG